MAMYAGLAQVYDAFAADTDPIVWCDAYLAQLGRPAADAHILDAACGTGRMAIELARRGARVTGLDASPDMLEAAAQNARAAGVQVPFVRQDLRALRVHRPIDAVLCACDGVNYLLETAHVLAFLRAAYEALKPGGMLLFDVSSPYKLAEILGNRFYAEERASMAYIWQNAYAAPIVTMDITFFVKRPDNLYRRFEERHIQRAWQADELLHALTQAGFERAQAWHPNACALTGGTPALRLFFSAEKPAV